jgi:methionyl-tRNA formyltransferase
MPRRKLIFLGSDTFFSQAVLRHLVQAGALIMRVIIPSLPFHVEVGFPVPQRQPHGLAAICGSLGIPLETIDPINPDSLCVLLSRLHAELVFSVCFPKALTLDELRVPTLGAYNLHPSLLPAYRGPMPLFWQFHAGEQRMGVTLHRMTRAIDQGPIMAQQSIAVAAGLSEAAVLADLADIGACMIDELARTAQRMPAHVVSGGADRGSYFSVCFDWSAERAYRFMSGTAAFGVPYRIEIDHTVWMINRALSFEPDGTLDGGLVKIDESFYLQLSPGVLHVQWADRL